MRYAGNNFGVGQHKIENLQYVLSHEPLHQY